MYATFEGEELTWQNLSIHFIWSRIKGDTNANTEHPKAVIMFLKLRKNDFLISHNFGKVWKSLFFTGKIVSSK